MNFIVRILFCAVFAMAAIAGELRRISDLNFGSTGSYPSNITVFANAVYFNAYTVETGNELYKYDGTNVTLVADINETKDDLGGGTMEGNDSLPSWLTPFNDGLFFTAYDAHRGAELWLLHGTTVARVADISPDINDAIKPFPYSSWPAELTVLSNALYFSANSGTVIQNYELWKYDGATTSRVANIRPDVGADQSSFPNNLEVFNGALYFMAEDGARGYELWKHTPNSTTTLTDINPGGAASSSYPKNFTAFGEDLIFVAVRDDVGYEPFKTDGTNVTLLADINLGQASSYPDYFAIFNGKLYFRAADAALGSELWSYDGISVTNVADINTFGESYPKNLTPFGSQLVFAADDGINGWELWQYNGGTAQIVTNLNAVGDSFPESLIVAGNILYFTATTPETGYEIFQYDGTNVTLATDINPGPGDSFPRFLTAFNNSLLFRAAGDGTNDWELWSYTPTAPQVDFVIPHDLRVERISSEIRLQWITSVSSTNIVQAASEVTGPFHDVSEPIIPNGSGEAQLQFQQPIAFETNRFFRIKRL